MAIGKTVIQLLTLVALAVPTAGCEGFSLPFMNGNSGEASPAPDGSLPPPKPKSVAAVATPEPVPSITPVPVQASSAFRRNVSFDAVRSRGISQVYDGRTLQAEGTFHGALAIKPKDRSLTIWLKAIEDAKRKKKFAGASEFRTGMIAAPGSPPNAANGYPGAVGYAPQGTYYPPPGYGGPMGYGAPAGYAPPAGYAAPQGYAPAPAGYVPAPAGYAPAMPPAAAVQQPASAAAPMKPVRPARAAAPVKVDPGQIF